jgi:hypothetical protein
VTAARSTSRTSASSARSTSQGINPAVQQAITDRQNAILGKIDSLLPASKPGLIQMPALPWIDVGATSVAAAVTTQAPAGSGDVYWVSFARSDTPKAYELYSAYKTQAEANKAAAEIRAWAARTGWKVADIQIEKEAGSKPTPDAKAGSADSKPAPTPPAKDASASPAKGWLANTYNPPPISLPSVPALAPPSAAAAASVPAAARTAPSSSVARAQAWVKQEVRQIKQEVAMLRKKGVLRTLRDEAIYYKQGLRSIGALVAEVNERVEKAKSIKEKIEKVLDFVAGEVTDFNHPAWKGAKEMLKVGIDTQEKNLVKTGDPWLDGVLKTGFQWLKDVLKDPWSLMKDKGKEGIQRLMTP